MDNKRALVIKPLIIKKSNLRILNTNLNDFTFSSENLLKEDVLYDTTDVYFLKGEFQRLLLVSQLNVLTKQSRTVAKYFTKDGSVVERTSDKVVEVIGQAQYKTVFTALCSILDQELKIRSILALLTMRCDKIKVENDCVKKVPEKVFVDTSSQTDEMRIEKVKTRKRIRKPVSPYIVADNDTDTDQDKDLDGNLSKHLHVKVLKKRLNRMEKRITTNGKDFNEDVINENDDSAENLKIKIKSTYSISNTTDIKNLNVINHSQNNNEKQSSSTNRNLTDKGLPVLESISDELSVNSDDNLTVLSDTPTYPELLTNPTKCLNNLIDQHTKVNIQKSIIHPYKIPGTDIIIPYKPEDIFHYATTDNLKYLDAPNQMKLKQYQLKIDQQNCLIPQDEYGNLPIHVAVLDNDLKFLVRQCIVLKLQGSSVDVLANGQTALKLAIATKRATLAASLIRHGACPLRVDASHGTSVHLAAGESDVDVLRAVITSCVDNVRRILQDNEDLWEPEMEKKSNEELSKYLIKHMCSMFNKQGYNPLMLASMLGYYDNVRVLLEHGASVNDKMPTSGHTALYLAVSAACISSIENGNKAMLVDHFRKTIELLLQNGADPYIENNSGTNVQTLLQDSDSTELYMLIASRGGTTTAPLQKETDIGKLILVKGKDGKMHYEKIDNDKKKRTVKADSDNDGNLVIVEDVVVKPGNTRRTDRAKKEDTPKRGRPTQNKMAVDKVLKKSNGVKRKQSDTPKVSKQAKINK